MNRATRDGNTEARRARLGAILALLLALLAATPLFAGSGMVLTRAGGDSPFLLVRVQQLTSNLQAGVFPARWLPDGAYGLGYPFYDFYAPLPYYAASFLHWVGCDLVLSIQATQALGFILASIATYALARNLGASAAAALAAAAVYTFAPYHLVNVYVRGDALGEFAAMALYPLVLLCLQWLRQRLSPARVVALGVSYASLVLCHNVSALLFTPLVLVWLAVLALTAPASRRRGLLGRGIAGLSLGLLLSVWFWAPALREQPLVQLQEQTTGYLHYAGHFLRDGLFQPSLAHDYTLTAATHPFRMGLIQAVIGLGALIALSVRTARGRGLLPWQVLTALAALAYTAMMLPLSSFLWEHLPLIAMAQFPWRILSIQSLLVALIAIELVPRRVPLRGWLASAIVIALTAWGGMAALSLDRIAVTPADVTPERFRWYETYSGNIGTTIRHEYLPRWMVPHPYTSAVQLEDGKPAPLALQGELVAAVVEHLAPDREIWSLRVEAPALLAFHTSYYPGWEAMVNGVPRGVEPLEGLGLIGLWVESGNHEVELRFTRTPVRWYSLLLSLAGAVMALGLAGYALWANPRLRRMALAGGSAALISVVGLVSISQALGAAESTSGPLVADFERCPLFHHEPGGVHWEAAQLFAYSIEPRVAVPGSTVRVALTWGEAAPLSVRARVMGLSGHLLPPAPVWSEATASVEGTSTTLQLEMPAHLAPGLYAVHIDVLDGQRVLTPTTADGQPMGTVSLRPLEVVRSGAMEGPADALGLFGPPDRQPVISLEEVHATAAEAKFIVDLTWRSLDQAPLNYWMSLRLQDADGQTLASRDIPPFLGGYPTSLWKSGELLADRVLVPLPDDRIASVERIEVVLYDRMTLAGIGAVTVPLAAD